MLLFDLPATQLFPLKKKSRRKSLPQHSSESNEHYTPQRYMQAVHEVFDGIIHLDPASCAKANERVHALLYYTKEDNGLQQKWFGNVFCNPPYGKIGNTSQAGLFCKKAVESYESGDVNQVILLLNANFAQKWFRVFDDYTWCLVNHRIKFIDAAGREETQPPNANIFVYLGKHPERFYEVFDRKYHIGTVMQRFAR